MFVFFPLSLPLISMVFIFTWHVIAAFNFLICVLGCLKLSVKNVCTNDIELFQLFQSIESEIFTSKIHPPTQEDSYSEIF